MEPFAWALRRFHTPVDSSALVLEVGAGGNPYPRANVLLDAYEATRERHWAPLISDRPTVLGFVENLPFKDHAFDFVIAAHVLEHSSDPARFIAELQRVAKAGYIEVPDAFMERINPYKDHRLEITCRDAKLVIRKKEAWQHSPEVVELYEDRVKPVLTGDLIPRHPFEFHVRYYWQNEIAYVVVNPEVDASWPAPASGQTVQSLGFIGRLRQKIRDLLRQLMSQRSRNAQLDLLPLLRCTTCHGTDLSRLSETVRCAKCGTSYPVRNSVVAMNEGHKSVA
jgi:SAM-dependent methyltransferase